MAGIFNKNSLIYMPRRKQKGSGSSDIPIYNYLLSELNVAGNTSYRANSHMYRYSRDFSDSNMYEIERVQGDQVKAPTVYQSISDKSVNFVAVFTIYPSSGSQYTNSLKKKLTNVFFTSDYSTPDSEFYFQHCYYTTTYTDEDDNTYPIIYDIRSLSQGGNGLQVKFNRQGTTATISGYTGNTNIKCYYHDLLKNSSASATVIEDIDNELQNTIKNYGNLYLTEEELTLEDFRSSIAYDRMEIIYVV